MISSFFATHQFNIIQVLLVIIGYLLPLPLGWFAYVLWHHYRQERFIMGIEWILFEVQVPREQVKSPAAMELIFSYAFYHKSGKGFWEEYIIGAPWLWFSCEIASTEGRVHFYVRTPSRIRNLVETQIYAQYPQAKVVEVDDYTVHVPQYSKDGDWHMWGCEFTKLESDAMPIKTWRKMEDMKSGVKEEVRVDPITPTIEFLGSLGKGQQVWIQIIVRQSIRKYHSHASGKHVDFMTMAREHAEALLAPFTKIGKGQGLHGGDSREVRAPSYLDPIIKDMILNLQQIHFDCGIRLIVLANKKYTSLDDFNNLRRNSRLVWRQYAAPYSNELDRRNSTQYDSPWADPTGLGLTKIKKRMLNFYRMRTFFHPPIQYSFKWPPLIRIFLPSHHPQLFVFSLEELATIYHFPGLVSETPSFKRIESKIAKPPTNLPV